MRGTKLTAWRLPLIWNELQKGELILPENSKLLRSQKNLLRATRDALAEVARDVRGGLLETVGVESELSTDGGRCSMILRLPGGADAEKIARAIDLENIEAWLDEQSRVRIAVSPWYSTKDVDQTVLSAVKVIHVLLGIHATDNIQPETFGQKLLSSVIEVMQIQKGADKGKK